MSANNPYVSKDVSYKGASPKKTCMNRPICKDPENVLCKVECLERGEVDAQIVEETNLQGATESILVNKTEEILV